MKRALLISWLFPPHASIGAKRAYRFARHLPSFGWSATVLCGRAPPERLRDPTPIELPDGVDVVADYDAAWLAEAASRFDAMLNKTDRSSRAIERVDAAEVPPGASLASRLSARLRLAVPTESIAVHLPHAIGAVDRILATRRARVVWTTSYPFSAHLLGLHAARRWSIPWVADLRDPWTPHFTFDSRPALTQRVEAWLERTVFENARAITVTSEALRDEYRTRYPRLSARFECIRNGFDPIASDRRSSAPGPRRLVHFGQIYGERTLEPVLRALSKLRDRDETLAAKLTIENLGRLDAREARMIERERLERYIVARRAMPYLEGIQHLRTAAAALLLCWGSEHGPLFVPGKVYDYLLAGVPILAIGDNPEVAKILEQTNAGEIIAPDDIETISDRLARIADGRYATARDPRVVQGFTARAATEKLASLFDRIGANQ